MWYFIWVLGLVVAVGATVLHSAWADEKVVSKE